MCAQMRGMALVEMLIGLSVLTVLLSAALPLGHRVYARAAVTYEAMRLAAELRRIQAISRTTATVLYVLDRDRAGFREPTLFIRADGYDIRHHLEGRVQSHSTLPLVRLERDSRSDRPAVFDGNGGISREGGNMTIRVYAHLCAPDDTAGVWSVSMLRRTTDVWQAEDNPGRLAGLVREELARREETHLPLALALPEAAANIVQRELPAALTGEELRRALLWLIRAETEGDAHIEEKMLCCTPLTDVPPYRYWTAVMPAVQVRAVYAAFAEAGLSLQRLTVCPPGGGMLAPKIEAARAAPLPWAQTNSESETSVDEQVLPAIYAGLLFHPETPAQCYWGSTQKAISLCRCAAAAVAVLAAVLFWGIASDIGSYMTAVQARDEMRAELLLHSADQNRLEEETELRADMEERAQLLGAFLSESRPLRALLIRLGTAAGDGVRLTALNAEGQMLRIEGEAVHYAALTAMMTRLQEDAGFLDGITLERAEHERGAAGEPAHVHFVLRAAWRSEV